MGAQGARQACEARVSEGGCLAGQLLEQGGHLAGLDTAAQERAQLLDPQEGAVDLAVGALELVDQGPVGRAAPGGAATQGEACPLEPASPLGILMAELLPAGGAHSVEGELGHRDQVEGVGTDRRLGGARPDHGQVGDPQIGRHRLDVPRPLGPEGIEEAVQARRAAACADPHHPA